MADGAKKISNGRTVLVLLLLVVGVLFFILPYDGQTGWQRVQKFMGAAPTTTPEKNVVIPRGSPSTYSQEIVLEGRPRVDDGATNAQPLDDLTARDRDALEKLIRDSK